MCEPTTTGSSRREFLRLTGFAVAGTALGGCQRAEEQYAVPALIQTDELVSGRSYDYASTCGGCHAGCGVLVKNRDGRPIKLEGNPEHPLSRGGLCAPGQASLLGLYDRLRLRHALIEGREASWGDADRAIRGQLDDIRKQGGMVRFLTGSLTSPTTRALIQRFLGTFADARHVVHDTRSCSAILAAHARTHGLHLLPHFHLEKAEVIVSFDADFLGAWLSPVEFTAAYQAGRRLDGPEPRPAYHVQFESRLSLTGGKADQRHLLAPGAVGLAMSHLAIRVARRAGVALPRNEPSGSELEEPPVEGRLLDRLADRLWEHRQRGVILCGNQDVDQQVLCNLLNHLLGNYGATVDVERPSYQQQGDDAELQHLLEQIHAGKVAALFVGQCNPVHDLPEGEALAEALRRVPLLVSCAQRLDETAELARYVCPVPHYLESWNDAEAVNGLVSLVQPAIAPLGDTRSLLETLMAWSGKPVAAYDLLRESWERDIFPRSRDGGTFQSFWDQTLHDGFAQVDPWPVAARTFDLAAVRLTPRAAGRTAEGTYSLVLYSKVGLPDASHAYNPWLHELPDPISKVTWDNYASLSPAAAALLGVGNGDVVRLEASDDEGRPIALELPALLQPGQHDHVVAVALGYGSRLSERFATIGPSWLQAGPIVGADGLVGKNAAALLTWSAGSLGYVRDGVHLTKAGTKHPLAATQSYDLLTVPEHLSLPGQELRPIIRETTLSAYRRELARGANPLASEEPSGSQAATHEGLWPDDHPTIGPRWGMVIDLQACTGCSACVIACQAENNVPVVGKDEVLRRREMYWIRIDRYYTERDGGVDVAHQPMLCQHCGNAPCEAVCPVLATVHSSEGLNQQVYNRCVGTRYCANNCPYKVRRFNWFDYARDDSLQNLVLNPEVTVRSRGVMEKCTFCVQRIQETKVVAGGEGRRPRDGEIQTACQQSCPAQAIMFGDLNDPASKVARLAAGPRSYRVLEELNIRPAVSYLGLVRDRSAAGPWLDPAINEVRPHG